MMPRKTPSPRLNVFSIFCSISGEYGLEPQGTFTCFVRLAGCNLRCSYCDTKKAWERTDGVEAITEVVLESVLNTKCNHVLLTGGEPLLQQGNLVELCSRMKVLGKVISVETNGSIIPSIQMVDLVDGWVVDYKLPGSGMNKKMMPILEYTAFPRSRTVFKFVCCNEEDLVTASTIIHDLRGSGHFDFAVSAVAPQLSERELTRLVTKHKLNNEVVLSVQIHKYIFPEGERGDQTG